MRKTLTLSIVLVTLNFGLMFGQTTDSLSVNSEVFFQQLSEILLNTPSKTYQKTSQSLLDRFYLRWSIGRFNKDEKDEIRSLIEKMRARKVRTYPYLYDYIYALTLISESQQIPKSIIAWHAYANRLLDQKKTSSFDKFLEFTIDLFENQRFHKKNSLSWFNRKGRFNFLLDTNLLVVFQKGNLVCATRKDSSIIKKTSGTYNYDAKKWFGDLGEIDWGRFGEEAAKDISVIIDHKYIIEVDQPSYSIDSVTLHYNRFFSAPVLGKISERITSSPPNKRSSFPRFDAYFDNFELYNIYPEISYFGGAMLEGLELFGIGTKKSKAIVKLTKSDSLYAMIRAEKFRIEADKFISSDAEFVFYFDKDSLYHPSLRVKYSNPDRKFVMYTESNGKSITPFFDSYHELDIYVQAVFWKMNDPELAFKRIRAINNRNIAQFVSSNYFSDKDFYRVQGIDDINPFYVIDNYLKKYGESDLKLNALAAYMKKSPDQVSALLIDLSKKGFLVYNSRTGKAVIKDRFYYFLDSKAGKIDYDVITLRSSVNNQPNATINLNTLDLVVNGVPEVSISDSQEVYIYPYDKTISFKKNRDFSFEGHIHMGLLDFYTKNSLFVYDSFMLKMNYVDSLAFQVYYQDSVLKVDSLIRVKNVIEDMVGTLYIDKPQNKSGLIANPQYPIFVSNDVSYVYFNEKSIQDSTLLPENFYYALDPFVFDSIESFITDGLEFEGNLTSAGIFPMIKEPLTIMPDYSLGFDHTTPSKGYEMYGGMGTYTHDISLSNDGFWGNGSLEYLSSFSSSDYFKFYPDSLSGLSNNFTVEKNPDKYNFSSAHGDTVAIKWTIDTNVMTIASKSGPINIYDNSWLDGILSLNPQYMKGEGKFLFDQSEIVSDNINFRYGNLTADSADFLLKNKNADSILLDVRDYFAKIDFDNQQGWFTSLNDYSLIKFPINKFVSTLDEVEWVMDEDKLLLSSNLKDDYMGLDTLGMLDLMDYNLKGPEFISHADSSDTLRFFAGNATYNLSDFTIDVEKVKLIKVADIAIFPNNETVKILKGAKINTLNDALIVADTFNAFHSIYDAEINIAGRNQYNAKGWIDYSDRNDMKQPIYLTTVAPNANGITTGFGQIPEEEIFFLSPEYFFRGEVSMVASRKNLRFNGGYKLNEECVANLDNWVSFNQILDEDNISFDVTQNSTNSEGKRVFFGLGYSDQYRRFYPMILEPLKSPNDKLFINSTGKMIFDTLNNQYSVGNPSRFIDNNKKENFVSLDNNRCVLRGDGNLNLGLDLNMFNILASGEFEHVIYVDSTYINSSMLLDFYFDEKAISMITDSLRLTNSEGANMFDGLFPLFLRKNLPQTMAEKLITEISLYGQMKKIPESLSHTIIFNDLKLYWDSYTRSYISMGKLGVGYMGGNVVNKYIDGWLQIEKGRTGSEITIYLKPTSSTWYYFNYKNGIMQVISSDNFLNEHLESINDDKRILNSDSDDEYYEYVISTRRKSIDFVRKMENIERN